MSINKFLVRLIVLFLFFPILIMVFLSLSGAWSWPYLMPKSISLRGYLYVFTPSTKILKILINSILLSLIVTFITIAVSLPAANALAFYNFKGKNTIKVLLFLPLIVPMIAVTMGIHLNFIRLGIANTYLGVILIHVIPGIPYGVKILLNVFEFKGNKIELQAKILGASKWQVLRYITIPIIMPTLVVAGSVIYIISFTQYFITFLIGGGKVITYSIILFPFAESGDRTILSALSVIFVISVLAIIYLSEKIVKKNL
ncbi:ABC transporter permease [Thermobrachium celere]|nr:ABC transporter permease [Thermobrachium celere]